MRSRQLPAERGLLQTFFCFCNAEKGNLATGGAENFSFHSLHHCVLKSAKHQGKNFPLTHYYNRQGAKWPGSQTGSKKSSKSFSDLLLLLVAGGGWYLVLKVRVRLAQQIRIYQFDFNSIAENSSYFFINFTGNTKMANIAAIVYIKNIIIVIFIFALSRYKITETIIPITANKAHKFPATLFA